jgi:hypothetical protein
MMMMMMTMDLSWLSNQKSVILIPREQEQSAHQALL